MKNNIILNTDSYKTSHNLQYPPFTESIYSYIEARGGVFPKSVFFGLQAFIKEYLMTPITKEDIDFAEKVITSHGGLFSRKSWEYILNEHDGYLPLEIKAVPEGTVIEVKNALVTVTNTDSNCAWLTSYVETALLRAVWYPTTVATVSYYCRKHIEYFMQETSDSSMIDYKLHDFGARGASSKETSGLGAAAHLLSFNGTDTLDGVVASSFYYPEEDGEMVTHGFSIPAAEHSTITSWGRDKEHEAYNNMILLFDFSDTVAVVSDSYDIWNAIENIWGGSLYDKVKDLEGTGKTLVIRPDSGDPVETPILVIEKLMDKFGYTVNSKGFRVLPDYLRVIQGDGIDINSLYSILSSMKDRGLSADNIAFGMGAGLLQKVDRDTMKFAMKASCIALEKHFEVTTHMPVFKDPVTDKGKTSKKGYHAVLFKDGKFETVSSCNPSILEEEGDILETVYKNGKLVKHFSFSEIKNSVRK